ncbi:MAG: hypothetical protein H5T50_02600 [Nitrososphaeria archaeon]|nr:hypothetical protein [Nitrososphaeria archaeon]
MPKFKPITKKPGELIKAEDWNRIQEDILKDLEEIEKSVVELRKYVESLTESSTILNPASPVGTSYELNVPVPGETASYMATVVGPITRQWAMEKGKVGEVCRFGLAAYLEVLEYWAGAEDGDKKALDIVFEYLDGTSSVLSGLYVNECSRLRPKNPENPYLEYLLSPNERVWYRYRLNNPHPEKEVFNISFRKSEPNCILKIGNVIHYRSKMTPL